MALGGSESENVLLDLEAGLRSLETAFPPPDERSYLANCLAPMTEVGGTPSIVAWVQQALSASDGQPSRRTALLQVLGSSLLPDAYAWEDTLRICAAQWPEWGYPYVAAALHFVARSEFACAATALERAVRRIAIGDPTLLRALYSLKRGVAREGPGELVEFASYWISRHEFTVATFASYADIAAQNKNRRARKDALAPWLAAFGMDPAHWPVRNSYQELASAGTLCIHVNQLQAQPANRSVDDMKAYQYWNRQALVFFQRALRVANARDGDALYARTRISETYSQVLRFQEVLSDADYKAAFETGIAATVELTSIQKGRGHKDGLRLASRRLARMWAAAVSRSRARGIPRDDVEQVIERTAAAYLAWIQFEIPRHVDDAESEYQAFLLANLEYHAARTAIQNVELSTIGRIIQKHGIGSPKEAIKLILARLDELASEAVSRRQPAPWKNRAAPPEPRRTAAPGSLGRRTVDALRRITPLYTNETVGLGLLLRRYLDSTDQRSGRLPDALRLRAEAALRRMTRLFVLGCTRAIDEGALERADQLLAVAVASETSSVPNLLHLATRLKLLSGAATADILAGLVDTPAKCALLRTDSYLRTTFFQTLARSNEPLDSDFVWDLATIPGRQGDAAEGADNVLFPAEVDSVIA
jgi:hypothetical protein